MKDLSEAIHKAQNLAPKMHTDLNQIAVTRQFARLEKFTIRRPQTSFDGIVLIEGQNGCFTLCSAAGECNVIIGSAGCAGGKDQQH
jgi:hypothetical protein